jgi:calcium-dependent protein kinase
LTKFQTGIISLLANLTASEEDLEKLKQVFEKLDEDQKGYLTIDKIKKGIEDLMHMDKEKDKDKEETKAGEKKEKKKLACKHPPDEYERMMQGMDRNGDGKITWDEFVTAAIDKIALLNDGNIKAAFNVLDADGNGRITKQELKAKFASNDKKDQAEADKDD